MSNLPPLPDPDRTMWQYGRQIDHYTADQMHAYARQYAAQVEAERDALRAVVNVYTGKGPEHVYAGLCPDPMAGWGARDPECPACQVMMKLDAIDAARKAEA